MFDNAEFGRVFQDSNSAMPIERISLEFSSCSKGTVFFAAVLGLYDT